MSEKTMLEQCAVKEGEDGILPTWTEIEEKVIEGIKEAITKVRKEIIRDTKKEWDSKARNFCIKNKALNYKKENNFKKVKFDDSIKIFDGMIIKCEGTDYWFDK